MTRTACRRQLRKLHRVGALVASTVFATPAPDHPTSVQLTGVYHNRLRHWAEL